MTWFGVVPVQAIATAVALGLPIALAGTGYVVTGLQVSELPPWHVVLPALLGIVVASTLFAPLGAWVAHRLHPTTRRRIFAVLLACSALRMMAARSSSAPTFGVVLR